MLLDDIRALFAERNSDRLTSAEIVVALGRMEDRPWSEWKNEKLISARQLARLIEPFGVRPGTIRTSTSNAKGYYLGDFADAFTRYLVDRSVTASQSVATMLPGHSHPSQLLIVATDQRAWKWLRWPL